MSGKDGTGPFGAGPASGRRGGGAGCGQGARSGMGAGGNCVCPKCGAVSPHTAGTPCSQIKCPDCGSLMIRG